MSIHSYTLKSLFFLTLLLQISCSTNKHKTSVELASEKKVKLAAEELDAAFDTALAALKNEAEDTKERGRKLKALKKKAEEADKEQDRAYKEFMDTRAQLAARTEKIMGVDKSTEEEKQKRFKSLNEEREKRFEPLYNKRKEVSEYGKIKGSEIDKLPEGPKKYNGTIKAFTALTKVWEAAAKFEVALCEELEKKSK